MKTKDILIGLFGFVAGIAFVISCGNEVKSLADETIEAIKVSFNGLNSSLSASNVQSAIDELYQKIISISLTPGPKGETGEKGEKGEKGDAGPEGLQGLIGLTGAIGTQGLQGPIGLTGATGPQGVQGPAGVPCTSCVNTASLADNAVTNAKILNGTIAASKMVPGTFLKFIGVDDISNNISSVGSAVIGNYLIPANTVSTGIIVFSTGRVTATGDGGSTVDLWIGPEGSESDVIGKTFSRKTANEERFGYTSWSLNYYDDFENWSAPVNVQVKAVISEAGNYSDCDMLIILGH